MNQPGEHARRRFLRPGLKATAALLAIAATAVFSLSALPAQADGPAPSPLSSVHFDQNLNAQVPLDLTFQDEEGQTVRLGDYAGKTPIVLTLNYYHCPNLCSLELDQLAQSLADLEWNLGDQYQVVTVSIDPRETPAQAAESKWLRLRAYARPNTGPGWHFLVGDQAAIARLTETVGFHYVYDAQLDEYEHPTGVIVLTPQGKIARYLYGVDFPPTDLRLALTEASQGKIGSPVEQILLYCYHYDPATGRYSLAILDLTRDLGIITVLGLGAFMFIMFRRDFKQDKEWLRK